MPDKEPNQRLHPQDDLLQIVRNKLVPHAEEIGEDTLRNFSSYFYGAYTEAIKNIWMEKGVEEPDDDNIRITAHDFATRAVKDMEPAELLDMVAGYDVNRKTTFITHLEGFDTRRIRSFSAELHNKLIESVHTDEEENLPTFRRNERR